MIPDAPRMFRDPDAIIARRAKLLQLHMVPLQAYLELLRAEGLGEVPDFDPLDGGVNAEILFLFEKPGPMTDPNKTAGRVGSGFISRDNDDRSAEATFRFMADAGIDRRRTLLANTVPWWNGTRKVTRDERLAGLDRLSGLLDLLPCLRSVVTVGLVARQAEPICEARGLGVMRSLHPSPINRAKRYEDWLGIPEVWRRAAERADKPGS